MKYILWLDDVRNPYKYDQLCQLDERDKIHRMIWARDVEQAIFFVKEFGPPVHMCLDHDLGTTHCASIETSMKFLKWLSLNYFKDMPRFSVHSSNPDGCLNIKAFMNSWAKSLENYLEEG